jgi:hypothetical protein
MFPPQPPQTPMPAPAPPPMAAPVPPQVSKADDTPIPMTADELAAWWKRVELAQSERKSRETRWNELLQAYLPATTDPEAINSNIHFRNTEQKKPQLFYRSPELILTPLEPLQDTVTGPDGQAHSAEDVTAIKQAVLNKHLGRDGVDLKRLADELLFEILQVSGEGWSKIAYEADFVEVEGQQIPVYEEWTWKKFSSKKGLKPHDWRSTRFDDAPWLGFEGVKPLSVAIREKLVPEDFQPNATTDTHVFTATKGTAVDAQGTSELVEFVEIWYRPAFFETQVTHRQMMRRLVLIKGLDQPAKHTKSPYQTLGADGRLTADSMEGFPFHVFTLRDVSDSSYVPSDAAMTDPLVRQENIWSAQDIKARDANIPKFLFDERIKTALEKLAQGDFGDGAGIDQATLAGGIEKLIAALPHLEKASSDIQGRQQIQAKIDQTLALGPNNAGAISDTVRSATEITNAQTTSNTRLKGEQDRFMSDVLRGIRKFDSLIQRFATETDYVSWVGQDGQRRLTAWNQTLIAGRFAYDVKPDSQLSLDESQRRQQDITLVNLMAQAPEANRTQMLRDLARDFGKDPAKWIQAPPPKQPELPKVNVSVASTDLNPLLPEYANVYQVLTQLGFKNLTPPNPLAILNQPAGPHEDQHGGALEGAGALTPVSKHAGELTGAPVGRGPM